MKPLILFVLVILASMPFEIIPQHSITLQPLGTGSGAKAAELSPSSNVPSHTDPILTTNITGGVLSGTVVPACPSGCSESVGSPISVTATPSTNYQFSSWNVVNASCSGGSSSNPCTFSMPNNGVNANATFITCVKECVTLIPTSVLQGQYESYNGSDFTHNGEVRVEIDSGHGYGYVVGTPTANGAGSISGSFQVGANVAPGPRIVVFTDTTTGDNATATVQVIGYVTVVFHTIPTAFIDTTDPGNISACSGTFTDNQSSSSCEDYGLSATANLPSPSTGWQFDHWTWGGGVTCDPLLNTTMTEYCSSSISGGSLTAVYGAEVSFHTVPSSSALIGWGSCGGPSEGDGQNLYSTSYGSVSACYVPSGYTLSSWSCSYGLTCSGSNDPTLVTFSGPGNITLNLKMGSLTCPVSTSLTASSSYPSPGTFTVSGTLTANGVGVGGETIVLVFGWNRSIVTITTNSTGSIGSYTYTTTAPTSAGSYNIDVFFLGDYSSGCPQNLPSKATAMITVT